MANSDIMKMPTSHKILSAIAMLFIIVALLITSAQIAIYGDSEYEFYEKEYTKYNVTAGTGVSMETTMDITRTMMDYLIGKEDELTYEVGPIDGFSDAKIDFFNDQDKLHMADVRRLFRGALVIRWILLALGIAILVILAIRGRNVRRMLYVGFSWALIACLFILSGLAVAGAVDFTGLFTAFHKLFFTNDLWLFDPNTDLMIRMLPEGFFLDMAVRIALIFISTLAIMWLSFWFLRRLWKRTQ